MFTVLDMQPLPTTNGTKIGGNLCCLKQGVSLSCSRVTAYRYNEILGANVGENYLALQDSLAWSGL